MGIAKILCTRLLPLVVAVVAVMAGWLASHEQPAGVVFATIIPLMGGYLPPTVFGPFKKPGTDAVPKDMQAKARPVGELVVQLPGGDHIPASGLGMCCRPAAYDHESAKRQVLWYILLGGRHIDTASLYLNHRAVGEGVAKAIARGVPRKEIFVTTKIYPAQYGYESAKAHVDKFAEELGLDYIDLVLMHAPAPLVKYLGEGKGCSNMSAKECRMVTWKGFSEAKKTGKVRNIGVSNFNIRQMEQLLEMKLAPIANNQFQYNPFAPKWKHDLVEYCLQKGISVTAWSSLGGLQNTKALAFDALEQLAQERKITVAQLLLRWALQKGLIVIPGTSNPKHMKQNLAVYDFQLSQAEMDRIDKVGDDPIAQEFFWAPDDTS